MAYSIGERIILTATYTTADGSEAAPQEPVVATIKSRSSEAVTVPMTTAGGGVYTCEFVATTAGTHQWEARSADGGVERGGFTVDPAL